LNRVALNYELKNAPRAVALNTLARAVKRDAIYLANRVDESRANVAVRDVVRPRFLPPVLSVAAFVNERPPRGGFLFALVVL
jgi:hypothetical protein